METEGRSLEPFDEGWDRALAVVAHPDDIEYGLAGAIARWTSHGKEVTYLLVTRGEAGISTLPPEEAGPLREQEERSGARIVGVNTVEFLDFPDGTIEYGPPLRRAIARAIRRYRPDIVTTNSPNLFMWPGLMNSADHRAVGLATLDAAQDAANRWIFRELLEEGLEPWAGVRMTCFGPSRQPRYFVDVSDYFEVGMASLREHATYLEALGWGDPEPFMRGFMAETGAQVGCELALAFEVVYGPGMPREALMREREEARAGE